MKISTAVRDCLLADLAFLFHLGELMSHWTSYRHVCTFARTYCCLLIFSPLVIVCVGLLEPCSWLQLMIVSLEKINYSCLDANLCGYIMNLHMKIYYRLSAF